MAVSTKAFSKFASDSPVDFGSEFCEKSIQNRARIGLECSCPPKSVLLVENLQKKPFSDNFPFQEYSKKLPLEPPWRHFGVPGMPLGALLSPRGLHRGSFQALQERLGTSQGHLEAPGIDLGRFLLAKPPEMVTVVRIRDAAS